MSPDRRRRSHTLRGSWVASSVLLAAVLVSPHAVAQEIKGTSGDDQLEGGSSDDTIVGYLGDDEIRGWDGSDLLRGGRGADRLYGGKKRDVLHGGGGPDVLTGGVNPDRLYGGDRGTDEAVFHEPYDDVDIKGCESVVIVPDETDPDE